MWVGGGDACADGTVPIVGGRHATSVAGAGLPVFIKVWLFFLIWEKEKKQQQMEKLWILNVFHRCGPIYARLR